MSPAAQPNLPDRTENPKGAERLPSIDGWRSICLMMVLGSHCNEFSEFRNITNRHIFLLLFNGHLGVRFFFVISGFLITYLLIKERSKTGKVCLKNFYIRRSLRILPVYFSFLAVIAVLQYLSFVNQKAITWLGDLTFIVNFLPRGPISGHLWSLSVEEQFYLIWPITFIWIINKSFKFTFCLLGIPFAVAILCNFIKIFHYTPEFLHPLFHHHSSLVNFDALAIGCIAAFALTSCETKTREMLSGKKGFFTILVGVSFIVIPALDLNFLSDCIKIVGPLLQTLGFSILLLSSTLNPNWFAPWNWSITAKIGAVSYSVYIWQQIFWSIPCKYNGPALWWMSLPGWLFSAILVGFISFYGLERPLLNLRYRFRNNS